MRFSPKTYFRKNRALILGIGLSLVLTLVFVYAIIVSYGIYMGKEKLLLHERLNYIKTNIERTLKAGNMAAFTIALSVNDKMETENFDSVGAQIILRYPYISGVELVKNGLIEYVYPYERHKSAIGFNIINYRETSLEAELAIKRKEIYYAGPLELQQGGTAIVGRLPLFKEGDFWGFSAVIVLLEDFLKEVQLNNSNNSEVHFQFAKINPNTFREEFFLDDVGSFSQKVSYLFNESGWKIYAYAKTDPQVYVGLVFIVFLGLSFSAGSGLYLYKSLKRPEQLKSLLFSKTKELRAQRLYYASMVNAIHDMLLIISKEGDLLDYHEARTDQLKIKPEDFLGKNIYEVFEKPFAKTIADRIRECLKNKTLIDQTYTIEIEGKERDFEVRFVPVNQDEVLIFVRDVTESKLARSNLERSEEKYKQLVEQASEGIVITEANGEIIEINSKGLSMLKLAQGKEKLNINDFVKLNQNHGLPFTEYIKSTGVVLEEAILTNFDGLELSVEISAAINRNGIVQAIIRDITKRKHQLSSIKWQNEKLKEIAWIQSHKVRAPLARILGLINYLDRYKPNDIMSREQVYLEIEKSAIELDLMIRNVVQKTEMTYLPEDLPNIS
ncbi:PAS domain S-box protein [Marivirga sp. S37H4]|uniref:PAS domain S-box protein n=1 Tax=Marivirga aurantiaca TaxID=2802615 RepID=A0A934X0Y7_9BACT|nr:PAS domain S-box protein [Marivirga aurantiaca]MBK6266400.1 PAS domain S-box protein [Marivirga aurantiaca]